MQQHEISDAFVATTPSILARGPTAQNWSTSQARQRVSPLGVGGTKEEILSKVQSIVVQQLAVEQSQVVPTASFTEDLGADSLDTVELIMALEEGFDVSTTQCSDSIQEEHALHSR